MCNAWSSLLGLTVQVPRAVFTVTMRCRKTLLGSEEFLTRSSSSHTQAERLRRDAEQVGICTTGRHRDVLGCGEPVAPPLSPSTRTPRTARTMTDVSDAPSHVDLAPLIAESKSETIKKSDLDQRQYRWLRLTNQMQVLLISDPECDHAAAAMDVNVGAASDPEEIPGLAHDCEHMLFLGTEKYPKENEYQNYLEEHGGGSNAFTAHENTNYYFVVQKDHLRGAIDRFAQFFLAPLFSDSATYRELNAVDSENNKNLQADNWRLQQISKWAADPAPVVALQRRQRRDAQGSPRQARQVQLSVGAGGGGCGDPAVQAEAGPQRCLSSTRRTTRPT